jgi:hypothetical protein
MGVVGGFVSGTSRLGGEVFGCRKGNGGGGIGCPMILLIMDGGGDERERF